MKNSENIHKSHEADSGSEHSAIEAIATKRTAELERTMEKAATETQTEDAYELTKEAQEIAQSKVEKVEASIEKPAPKRTGHKPTKRAKAAAYKKQLHAIQADMPLASRAFSKIIHTRVIERTSDVAASTVARPNALLSGAVSALIFTAGIYWIARYYGYPLSGSESIASFTVGYAVGILYDYLRLMIRGRI